MSSKLFTFNRGLPAPFDKVGRKVKVSSTYGDGTEATLSSTVVKAVMAYCACRDGARPGAVGACGTKGVAEYKSASGADVYHLAVYDPNSGTVLASKYDSSTEMMETYSMGKTGQDGAAVLLAMIPALAADREFADHLDAFMSEYRDSFSDLKKAVSLMAILCDNAYRRVNDKTCTAHLPVNIDSSGNVMRVSQTHLDSGSFTPDQVLAGEFTILAHTGPAVVLEQKEAIPHSDFVGKYVLTPGRVLTAHEQTLVPTLAPWYVLPEEVVSICAHAQKSTGKALPMRNFLLRGPAGTGKTEGAKAIAAGLHLPYVKCTCSANTEVYDFIGQVFPDTDGPSTGDADLDRERQELKEMGGVTYENVKKLMRLPDLDDMDYDPEGTYLLLTGHSKAGATSQDCMAEVMTQVTDKLQRLCTVKPETANTGQTYTYMETDFIRVLKHGYVVEIQEPTTIMQPGVLVGLNSLLEQNGTITLPTGEVIRRHPDAVVVVTTNVSYEGCRGMNQSVLDRMNLTQDIELPAPEIMAQRAMSVTGCEDDYLVSRMVQVVNDMTAFCRKNGIADGCCGMRSLIDWIMSAEITGDPHASVPSSARPLRTRRIGTPSSPLFWSPSLRRNGRKRFKPHSNQIKKGGFLLLARVNHKKIKQLIAQKQKTITDRQFFVSRALAVHFEDIAAAQTKRYSCRRRVRVRIVWRPKESGSARTDNGLVWINAGHPSVTAHKTRQERYEQVCGLFAHELGHVLYTDFLASQTYHRFQESGKWYPEPPPLRSSDWYAETEYLEMLQTDPERRRALGFISHESLNVLEDGYIEQRMITDYPGILGANLEIRRESSFEELPTVTQMIEREEDGSHIWLTILQCILAYMKWGQIKYGETPLTDERIQTVFALLSDLDTALVSQDFRDRCRTANIILIRCWSYIKDFVDRCKDMVAQASASGSEGDAGNLLQQLLSALAGGSTEGTGETEPVPTSTPSGASGGSPTAGARAATAQLAADTAKEQEDESGPGTAAEDDEAENEPQPEQETAAPASAGQEEEGTVMAGQSPPGACQPVSEQETGRILLTDNDTLSAPEGGTTERDDDYQGTGYTGAASDIQRILEKIAEGSVCSDLERQRTKELTELAQSISYGNIHDGVSMTVHRIAEVNDDLKEQYQEVSGNLLHISKQLQKSVLQQMHDSRRGGKQTGLLMGRRLDIHALSRSDGRVFYKNALPNEIPALSVGLLLDESGSMSSCDRATYARATAIILYDFCQALGIPIIVYGHSTGEGVDLYSYAEFDDIDQNDRYRMMDISARSSNRDGAALRYVAERLARRSEDVKLLMLVSDGQPADYGYYGTAAEEDLRGIKREYQRKGILFVAAAIGSDKENIERIYGDSFLDISDLSKLPVKLASIIKRFIRV